MTKDVQWFSPIRQDGVEITVDLDDITTACGLLPIDGSYGGTFATTSFCFMGTNRNLNKVYITKVLYNNPATVVFWSDGTETRNICPKNTLYNPDAGLAFCVLKKLMGGDEMAKLFNDWESEDYREDKNHWIELKDVRKKHKEQDK